MTVRQILRQIRRSPPAGMGLLLGLLWLAGAARAQEYVPTADPEHPKLRYADSLVSLNDRCPVRQGKLNSSYRPVYVNGQPVGFC